MADREAVLNDLYSAFNSRDIDAVLAQLHPDVDWPNAWEGGRVAGRDGVRDYWTRQWAAIDSHAEPTGFGETSDGRTKVAVHQFANDLDGNPLGEADVVHVYAFDDKGLVTRMDVVEPD